LGQVGRGELATALQVNRVRLVDERLGGVEPTQDELGLRWGHEASVRRMTDHCHFCVSAWPSSFLRPRAARRREHPAGPSPVGSRAARPAHPPTRGSPAPATRIRAKGRTAHLRLDGRAVPGPRCDSAGRRRNQPEGSFMCAVRVPGRMSRSATPVNADCPLHDRAGPGARGVPAPGTPRYAAYGLGLTKCGCLDKASETRDGF
jgi:hypothetical protein